MILRMPVLRVAFPIQVSPYDSTPLVPLPSSLIAPIAPSFSPLPQTPPSRLECGSRQCCFLVERLGCLLFESALLFPLSTCGRARAWISPPSLSLSSPIPRSRLSLPRPQHAGGGWEQAIFSSLFLCSGRRLLKSVWFLLVCHSL